MNAIGSLFRPAISPFSRHRLSVLIFHRVLPAPDAMLAGEPSAAEFEQTMRWVKSVFNVIPLSEGVRGIKDGRLPPRALSITFDDGYANNATIAAPILARLGLHATFFIATGFLDGGRMFNDTVIEAVRNFDGTVLDLQEVGLGTYATATIDERRLAVEELLRTIKYRPEAERAEIAELVAETAKVVLPTDLMMTSHQASELARNGFELGGHTVNHPILAQLEPAEARAEVLQGRARVEELAGRRVGLFAYPNGKPHQDYGTAALSIVRELGFDGAVSTSRGSACVGSDSFQIPRFTPWDRRPLRFLLQATLNLRGVEPTYVVA
jgi:peptidoglycan/xylan/chitin deacetylase (PgdA/CDA1 family)